MRALLVTNIIIHREITRVTSRTIGQLFYWLDKLHFEKSLHSWSLSELKKYDDPNIQDLYEAKLTAYTHMKTVAPQSEAFLAAANISAGTKMPRAEWSKVSAERFFVPEIVEQRKIAGLFACLDRRINNLSSSLQELHQLKHALLQQLFI